MLRIAILVVCVLTIEFLVTPAFAQSPTAGSLRLGDNAALDYWQATYFMQSWNDKDQTIVDSYDKPQIDHDAAAHLLSYSSIRYIHQGAKRMWCDWGLHLDQGPNTLLPYLNESRAMADVMFLESRVNLLDGDESAAADDWFCALAVGRHAGCNGIPICLLVDYGIENMVATNAGLELNHLHKPALDGLSAELEKLPPGGTLAQAAANEQEINQRWLLAKLQQPGAQFSGDSLRKLLMTANGKIGASTVEQSQANERVDAALAACGGNADGLTQRLQALDPLYDRIARTTALPYDQFVKQWPDIQRDIDANPVAKVVMSSLFQKVVRTHSIAQARLAMFEAAIDVLRNGPDALRSHPDPFGNGPFTYKQTSSGFELTSAITDETNFSKPVMLKVGRDSQ